MTDPGMQSDVDFERRQDICIPRDSAETHDKDPFAYIEFRGKMNRSAVTISQDECPDS
jgi:hypothetical protein